MESLISPPYPLQTLEKEIFRALEAKLYFLALAVTLTIPDICCALASPRGITNGAEYARWWDTNMGKEFDLIPGEECYRLRCGVSHEASLKKNYKTHKRAKQIHDGFAFVLPGVNENNSSYVVEGSAMICPVYPEGTTGPAGQTYDKIVHVDLMNFCEKTIIAAKKWYAKNAQSPTVRQNAKNLLGYRREPKYALGIQTVIA